MGYVQKFQKLCQMKKKWSLKDTQIPRRVSQYLDPLLGLRWTKQVRLFYLSSQARELTMLEWWSIRFVSPASENLGLLNLLQRSSYKLKSARKVQ
ncbi:hypothetical protein LWI28_017904 [Acer negundo]|uniref:Uncharacterized protein n=1 Tax=Acer negundo TaxID=4023 RepID=A0AAD5IJQ5_ACENE|nr:hypothetical protein LWI28_017904 [Acer negundo]